MTTTRSWTLTPSPASASRARWSWERASARSLHVDGQERPFFHQAAWTTLTSHVGLPTLITPIATTKQGLPIAVQLVGAPYRDRTLLALAEQLAAAVDREPAPYSD